ncbi:MAG: hypothetical protein GY781_15225 [Gammaproteobacteria bacterium]|nr:hypothetical protein [Gammaproteobacteria bacterium]
MKKYIATCIEDDWIFYYGTGNTPDEAYVDFMEEDFGNHCNLYEIPAREPLDVYIYTNTPKDEPDWETEGLDPGTEFILDKLIETRSAESV